MDRSEAIARLRARLRLASGLGLAAIVACLAGCESGVRSPKVVFLDGAGYYGAHFSVRRGMEQAGYIGAFERFAWSSWLGPGADHLVGARSLDKARQLVDEIVESRQQSPNGKIYLMGLSAGTTLILSALEELPDGVNVDAVVLFSSSVSSHRDLLPALEHINGRLYATCSPHDAILTALPVNADGGSGRPAGLRGFIPPSVLGSRREMLYSKVVNIPWRPSYAGYGWHGGHVEATTSRFVAKVIAPRILSNEPYPLDRPLTALMKARRPSASGTRRAPTSKPGNRKLEHAGAGGT